MGVWVREGGKWRESYLKKVFLLTVRSGEFFGEIRRFQGRRASRQFVLGPLRKRCSGKGCGRECASVIREKSLGGSLGNVFASILCMKKVSGVSLRLD